MTFSRWTVSATLAAGLSVLASGALAQAVDVQNAWARATVQGQKATGAFMTLTAPSASKLVSVSSPVAGVAEVHEMKMEGDVMKMRAIPGLDLPAGKAVDLKPGGYHVMLMDLKLPLQKDTTIPKLGQHHGMRGEIESEALSDLWRKGHCPPPGDGNSCHAAILQYGRG